MKKMMIVPFLLALVSMMTGQASALKYSKLDKRGAIPAYASSGTQTPKNYRWKGGGLNNPLSVTASIQSGYMANVPTRITVKYNYRNAKLRFANGRKTSYRKWFRKHKLGSLKATLNVQWPAPPGFPNVPQVKRLRSIGMNRTRTVVFLVSLPCIQPVDFSTLKDFYPTVPAWVCWPPDITIELQGYLKRTKPKSFASVSHKITLLGAFVYPQAQESPSPAQPQDPSPPQSEPTGQTGSTGPSGPTA